MESAAIRVSVAPVLAGRTMNAEQVTQALLGAPVTILERTARWARIRMEDEYEGWISTAHLSPGFPGADEWIVMSDLWVNLRTRPDYRMPVRQIAFVGTTLPLGDRRDGWLGVRLPGGGLGWLEEHRGRLVTAQQPAEAATPALLLETGRRFLGVPYLWGGSSPLGLDCSGFVQLVYRLHGIRLPRDADQQAGVGHLVSLDGAGPDVSLGGKQERSFELGAGSPGSAGVPACSGFDMRVGTPALPGEPACSRDPSLAPLEPGDAVFFCSPEARERITHVGLALGDGRFIHSAGSDRVRVNALSDTPYGERLVAARRYLCAAAGPLGGVAPGPS